MSISTSFHPSNLLCSVLFSKYNKNFSQQQANRMYDYAVTLLVYCSRHTLRVRMWRILEYLDIRSVKSCRN